MDALDLYSLLVSLPFLLKAEVDETVVDNSKLESDEAEGIC